MGLLDSDAEELKRNKSGGENSSGRKVNQSGLGALKGLSKYSNLTAKYRTTGKSENTAETKSVEHSRGTFAKSVQSQCEVGADVCSNQTPSEDGEVSAKSVQSQCSLEANSVVVGESDIETKSVQSQGDKVVFPTTKEVINEPIVQLNGLPEVRAKSVHGQLSSENTDVKTGQNSSPVDTSLKSVQSQCDEGILVVKSDFSNSIVSAKSVHDATSEMDLKPDSDLLFDELTKIKSQCKVSAEEGLGFVFSSGNEFIEAEDFQPRKSVQSQCKVVAERVVVEANLLTSEVGAKSVQSRCDIESAFLLGEKNNLGAKSVQSQCEVGAKELKLGSKGEKAQVSAKSVQQKVEVRAKTVQTPGKVSAGKLEEEVVNSSKSKVLAKNLEAAEPMESIISISGSQRVIVDFLFQLCLWNNSLITPPITKQQLTSETGLLEETALSSIKRLRKKNIIDRYAYKDGKAGWTQYQFSESSYKELLHLRQVGAKSVQRPHAEIERGINSSPLMGRKRGINSFVSLDTKQGLSEQGWFKNLDFSKIYPIGPMVVNPAIRSLIEEKLSPDLVQDFINRFTSWTSTQGRITSPIGLFCDKLKELAREGDSPVFGCMTEEERQAEAAFAAQVEKAKAEMELIRKARSENAEKEADSAFESWYTSSSDSEKFELGEPSSFAPLESEAYKRILKAAYLEKVSPKG